jgi:hypothetical protein
LLDDGLIMSIPFPAYAPSRWELTLPGYRVIDNSWRSTHAPEILGSLPEGATLSLSYQNVGSVEALQLLLPWRASGGGQLPLDPLPAEVAAGIDDAAFAARLLDIAPLSWVVAKEPSKDPVKNGRFNVDVELVSELRFSIDDPVLDIVYLSTLSGDRLETLSGDLLLTLSE